MEESAWPALSLSLARSLARRASGVFSCGPGAAWRGASGGVGALPGPPARRRRPRAGREKGEEVCVSCVWWRGVERCGATGRGGDRERSARMPARCGREGRGRCARAGRVRGVRPYPRAVGNGGGGAGSRPGRGVEERRSRVGRRVCGVVVCGAGEGGQGRRLGGGPCAPRPPPALPPPAPPWVATVPPRFPPYPATRPGRPRPRPATPRPRAGGPRRPRRPSLAPPPARSGLRASLPLLPRLCRRAPLTPNRTPATHSRLGPRRTRSRYLARSGAEV